MMEKTDKSLMRRLKPPILLALFISIFLANLFSADIQCVWSGVKKIVAVGDLHGDYNNFLKILKGTGLIDEELHWTGEKTHLVQIGDIMDRGPDAKKIFDLLMILEKEAEEAGGKIHMLIGNHEEMNITDIAFDYKGYIWVEQFVSFLSDKYKRKKEKNFWKKIGSNPPNVTDSDSSLDSNLKPYWENVLSNANRNKRHPARKDYTKNFNQKYGKWILKHNAVIKINDIIFVHGGISERFSAWKLEEINNRLRMELDDLRRAVMNSSSPQILPYQRQIVYVPNGPLWYREFATLNEEGLKEEVDRILENLNAQYMVTAHTPQLIRDEDHMKRFDGRIWIIDTGISKAYGGHISALIYENGKFTLWLPELQKKESVSIKHMRELLGMIWIFIIGNRSLLSVI